MLALQAEEGEGSGNSSKPQPPPFTAQPTHEEPIPNIESSSPQKTQSPRQALNKDTELPQTSVPIPNDSSNIAKIQSTTTPTEIESHYIPISAPSTSQLPTSSPSMQTTPVAEEAATMPHDSPLPRVHSLGSDEGSMTLNELMTQRRHEHDFKESDFEFIAPEEDYTTNPDISTANVPVSTAGAEVSTASPKVKTAAESLKTKLQLEQERLGLEEALRLQEQLDEEERQRIAKVHKEAITFNAEEWDNIQAQIKADEELAHRLQAQERERYSEADKARLLVELINERKRKFAQQRAEHRRNKPMTQAQQRTYMCNYIKHIGSHTLQQLKKLSFDEVKELFDTTIKRVNTFTPMESDDTVPKVVAGSSKIDVKQELNQEIPEEGMNVEALQTKYPIIDWKVYTEDSRKYWKIIRVGNHIEVYQIFKDMLKNCDSDDLVKLWSLVHERFNSIEPTEDKERELWVELKRLFKPDDDDILWKLQRYMHDALKWKLYDTCVVHHVSTERGHDIFMLVEKDYPLTRALMTLMLSNKLQVDEYSVMADELLRKIFILANKPRQDDKGIKWLDVEEPLDLVNISEELVYESKNGYEYRGRNFMGLGRDMYVFVRNISYVMDFTILENIKTNIDPSLSNVVFGRPFIEIVCLAINRKYGLMTFTDGIKEITFKTPYKDLERSELSSEGHDLLSSRIILSEDDYDRGCRKPSDLENGFYKDTIMLGPEYVTGMDDE
ncbi:hypothetical protein Tco_1217625 [Tanacetum coccineum]